VPDYKIFQIIKQDQNFPKFVQVLFVSAPVLELHNYSEEYSIWISPSVAGTRVSMSFYIFHGVISEGPSRFHLMPLRIKIGPSVSL
jgi:hypothetical protein